MSQSIAEAQRHFTVCTLKKRQRCSQHFSGVHIVSPLDYTCSSQGFFFLFIFFLLLLKWLSTKGSAPRGDPRPDILSPWRRRLSLPIPCHVHWPRSCCRSRARAADVCKKACFRGLSACTPGRVCSDRSCVRGARVRRGCAAGAWRAAWVRGSGAWRRGWASCVGRVPLEAALAGVGAVECLRYAREGHHVLSQLFDSA